MNASTTSSSPELVITRTFRASRELIWKAWTDPKQMIQWMGPRHHPSRHYENDLRPGGAWRSHLVPTDGSEDLWVGGVYRELVPPERDVHTEKFDDYPGESVVTGVLTESGGKTTMTATILYPSQEVRDIVLKSGMEHGAAESYDRLAEILG